MTIKPEQRRCPRCSSPKVHVRSMTEAEVHQHEELITKDRMTGPMAAYVCTDQRCGHRWLQMEAWQ